MKQISSKKRNEAGTPPLLFATLHAEYRFTVDCCAVKHNAKLARYWSPGDNGLAMPWRGERVWCNPPWRDIPPWLERHHEADRAVYLLPARTDREWWRRHKRHAECHYFVGQSPHQRPQMVPPPGVRFSSNPMSLVLFVFGAGATAGHEVWRSGVDGKRF